MYIYIRKLFENDAAGSQISFPREVAQFFFNAPDDFLSKKSNFSVLVFSLVNTADSEDVELQSATDFRFSTRLNTFLSDNGQRIETNDLLYVERFRKAFGVKLIKPSDTAYKAFDALLTAHDRHFLLCNDEPEEDLSGREDGADSESKKSFELLKENHNLILFGAPGTGKSFRYESLFEAEKVPSEKIIRTTFHPDTDYASFVGSYKPTMSDVVSKDEQTSSESTPSPSRITYAFVPQSFTKAYVEAWKNPKEDVFLIIEEINRGNCAQIFGDLFQLLDRWPNGVSKYPISADSDLKSFLRRSDQLGDSNKGIEGGKLRLPGNLYIWATMNTSDQSLFPMDSAFKRRWEQEYVSINYSDASTFKLFIAGETFDWGKVLHALNRYIKDSTHSTNKLLGNRFIQPKEGSIITYSVFRDKVLFYLFSDVFKDDDTFAEFFFAGKQGYQFFEDLYEKDDLQISLDFIHRLLSKDDSYFVTQDSNEEVSDEDESQ